MIPYDELVAALSAWRIKKGLPVADGAPPPVIAAPPRSAPPAAPARTAPPVAPPPPRHAEEALDVDDSAMIEEAALGESDFAYNFGQDQVESEPTSIGEAPEVPDRPTRRDNDW
jgi:hypothetical protein